MGRYRTRTLKVTATVPIGLRVTQDIYDRIEQEAATMGLSKNALLVGFLSNHYDDEPYNARLAAALQADENLKTYGKPEPIPPDPVQAWEALKAKAQAAAAIPSILADENEWNDE